MHLNTFYLAVAVAAAFPAGVFSRGCYNAPNERDCEWEGTAPFCGAKWPGKDVTRADGRRAVESTKDISAQALFNGGFITNECEIAYGQDCWKGYKVLYCRAKCRF